MSDTKEWFEGRLLIDNAAMARCYWKRVLAFLVVGLFVLLLVWPANASADPLFSASTQDGASITLYSEKCTLSESVINLPGHVVLIMNGRETNGCWGYLGGLFLFYWDSKRVGYADPAHFVRVTGA